MTGKPILGELHEAVMMFPVVDLAIWPTISQTPYYTRLTMQIEVVLRKFGNSTGVAFPPGILKDLGLQAGSSLLMDTTSAGQITLEPKRKFSLEQLLSQCNMNAKRPSDMEAWDESSRAGQEML